MACSIQILLSISLLLCCILETYARDYYDILGVKKNARDMDISRAFRRLARIHHPDRNQDDATAEDKFIEIAKAYEVLNDPTTRKHYDLYGDGDAQRSQGSATRNGFKFTREGEMFRNFNNDIDDMFRDFDRQFNQNARDRSNTFTRGFDNEPLSRHPASSRPGKTRGDETNEEDTFGHFGTASKTERCYTITRRVGTTLKTETTCS